MRWGRILRQTGGWVLIASCLALIELAGFAVYGKGLHVQRFADDYESYFEPPPDSALHFFSHPNPNHPTVYRPIESSVLVLIQKRFGSDTFPIHALQVALHGFLAWVVFSWMVGRGLPWGDAAIASLFMLASQANVHAVLGSDTLSQVLSALFGVLSLHWLDKSGALLPDDLGSYGTPLDGFRFLLSVLAFGLAVFSRETGASFLLPIFLILFLKMPVSSAKAVMIRFSVFLVPLFVYALARRSLDVPLPALGENPLAFLLGVNVPRNLASYLTQVVLPGSSVTACEAAEGQDWAALWPMVLAGTVGALAVLHGLVRRGPRLPLAFALFAILVLLPASLMNHVSDLTLYNAMPFLAVVVGLGMGKAIELSREPPVRRLFTLGLVTGLLLLHGMAVQQKTWMLKENGEHATALLQGLEPFLTRIPEGGELVLINPSPIRPDHSVFSVNGFHLLDNAWHHVHHLAGREDFSVRVVPSSQWSREPVKDDALALGLDPVTWRMEPVE